MITRFICLANSFKEGGRCVAGIEINNNNEIRMKGVHPKWIRPVCNSLHGEIETNLVVHLRILDIVEIDTTGFPDDNNYQSENVYFSENSLKIIGRYDLEKLKSFSNTRNLIFNNRNKSVSEYEIESLSYSLMLVNIKQFEVIRKTYEDNKSKPQCRLIFTYNNNQYDFPITDPSFLHRFQNKPDLLKPGKEILLCVSLGIEWQGWHYKLVAGIIWK